MKQLSLKISLFAATVIILMTLFLNKYSGVVDHFYGKFTSPKQHSLIVGESKSFMGVRPSIITERMADMYEMPMYNYAFTIAQTAFGELLLKSIERKIAPGTKNGLFILSVNPWVLSERPEDDVENGVFFERDVPPNNMYFVSMKPNPEYVLKNFESFNFKGIFRQISTLEEDGWQDVKSIPTDSADIKMLNRENEKWFSTKAIEWKKSDYRLRKFAETVTMLQKYGTVVIIRMPSSKAITEIEQLYWPELDSQLQSISAKSGVQFINFNGQYVYPTFDGIHFDHKTGIAFTQALCDSISKYKVSAEKRGIKTE